MAQYLAKAGVRTLCDISQFNQERYQCIKSLDGKMWEEEESGECGDDVKIVRMIFDRPSGMNEKNTTKQSASGCKRSGYGNGNCDGNGNSNEDGNGDGNGNGNCDGNGNGAGAGYGNSNGDNDGGLQQQRQ